MTAEDRVGVMDLFARYARAIDTGDLETYVGNFLPDGVIEYDGTETYRGRDAIRGWLTTLFAGGRIGVEPAWIRHFVGLPYIEGDGERASTVTYCVIFARDEKQRVLVPSVGSYHDTVVKREDGRWYFEKRIIAADLGSFTAARDEPAKL
ncbi:MAG TPA: nuclear transport factor 2 family protein [Dehalococcoidia bacterium]|nr:nuclear transport factor 2 family protein [Dehalococcoidia bacterium]